jgi:hypothetical protein
MRRPDLSRAAWRKSSFSNGSGGSCVEVGTAWPSRADSDKPAGDEITATASLSRSGGPAVAVRHSKDPDGPKLVFTTEEWEAFTAGIRAGEFDLG